MFSWRTAGGLLTAAERSPLAATPSNLLLPRTHGPRPPPAGARCRPCAGGEAPPAGAGATTAAGAPLSRHGLRYAPHRARAGRSRHSSAVTGAGGVEPLGVRRTRGPGD